MSTNLLDQYERYIDPAILARITAKGQQISGIRVNHLNTTAKGGGVAEILEALTPITDTFQIHHARTIVQLDPTSNHFTTHIVNLLQGNLPGNIGEEEKKSFLQKLATTLPPSVQENTDIYFVHDFQLVPLAELYSWMRPAIWFCHVDTANPNKNAEQYIRSFLSPYDLYVFNTALSVFHGLPAEHTQVITLGIDPFKEKHREISPQEGAELLRTCGIDSERPLITQVSRFDRWKNPWQVIDIYRQVKQQIPTLQVALVGAMEAADDINAKEILSDIEQYAQGDPDIYLLSDPNLIRAPEVNAFQRYSQVILQRSTREGFGLTVTEAMWKYQPVVGTSATGLRAQLRDGQNGYIVDETTKAAEYTRYLLEHRDVWQRLGQQAHSDVQHHFLVPMMVESYLDALLRVHPHRIPTIDTTITD